MSSTTDEWNVNICYNTVIIGIINYWVEIYFVPVHFQGLNLFGAYDQENKPARKTWLDRHSASVVTDWFIKMGPWTGKDLENLVYIGSCWFEWGKKHDFRANNQVLRPNKNFKK